MKRIIVALLLVLVMVVSLTIPAFADTSQDVTVTATPKYIAITNAPSDWTLNDITGSGKIDVDTVYYSNPGGDTTAPSATVIDDECRFTITNASTVATDVYVNIGDFSGGDANMTNSDSDGSNGATTYGAFSWHSGMTYASKVVAKTTGSAVLKDGLAATTNIKWGAEIETQTDAWTGGGASTATMTVSVQEDV